MAAGRLWLRLVWIGRQRLRRWRGRRRWRLYLRGLVGDGRRRADCCHLTRRIQGITARAHHAVAVLQDVVDVLLHGGSALVALIDVAHESAGKHTLRFRRKLRVERAHRRIDKRWMIARVAVS